MIHTELLGSQKHFARFNTAASTWQLAFVVVAYQPRLDVGSLAAAK